MKYELNSLIGQITEADCEEVLAQLPDKCVDLVLTDPPYGLGNKLKPRGGMIGNSFAGMGADSWDIKPSPKIFEEMRRVSKNQIVWGGNYFAEILGSTQCFLVWDKMNGTNPMADCEFAYTSFENIARMYRIHHFSHGYDKKLHPTQKPVPLFKWCLSIYSKESDVILDPFSGSGTTALACHALNRRFICIEREHKYVEISRNRLKEAQAQLSLFGQAKTEHYGSAENSIQQPQPESAGQTCLI